MTQTALTHPPLPHKQRHRRRGLALTVGITALLALLAVTGFVLVRNAFDDRDRQYLSTNGWPAQGQGAYQVGTQTPHASANEHPVPNASLAKVMTVLVVLEDHPLADGAAGPTITVTQQDVADTAMRRGRDESVVRVRAGEQFTERDALMAILLPSANNVAVLLAKWAAGSVGDFVTEMNREAHGLGMADTTYTDPSGFDVRTVSTARDQLALATAAAKNTTLMAMMAARSYLLPVAGIVHNTDTLLGSGGFVGMKTGSDDAAGGCFMFRAYRSIDGFNVPVTGVVLGQDGHSLINAALYAAKQLVDRIAPQPAHP